VDELRQRASTCPNFELVYRVTERASHLVGPHSTISLGDAVKLACERLRVCLDDEGFALVVVALGFRRVRQQARLEALGPQEERCRYTST